MNESESDYVIEQYKLILQCSDPIHGDKGWKFESQPFYAIGQKDKIADLRRENALEPFKVGIKLHFETGCTSSPTSEIIQ